MVGIVQRDNGGSMNVFAERSVSSGTAAALAGVDPSTFRRWLQLGLVPAWRTPGGRYRIDPLVVARMTTPSEGSPQPAPTTDPTTRLDDQKVALAQ
jgi:excisionase family DNA binding protein